MCKGTPCRRRRRRVRRIHGLQLPLHPQQVLAWSVMVAFVSLTFGAIVPALHSSLILPVSVILGTLFFVHVVTYFLALTIDPADPELRKFKRQKQVPEFDRNVHSHVIENGRCHLCNITITSQRTKHCSACNKCVDSFDHHCKWLNHCIGKRNYKIFIVCLITAILSCFFIMGFCIAEIVLYYFDRKNLAPWEKEFAKTYSSRPKKDEEDETGITCTVGSPYCHFTVFGASVYDGAFIGILSTLFSVALVAEVLLVHLAAFHAYINYLNLTTYEYIRGNNIRGSNSGFSFNAYGREENIDPEGAVCGWTVTRRSLNNQITPSSTTDTALLSTHSYDPSAGGRSPRSVSANASPSTPIETSSTFAQHNHNGTHRNLKGSQLSLESHRKALTNPPTKPTASSSSSVPTLPQIPKPASVKPNRKPLSQAHHAASSSQQDSNLTNEIEVRYVSIPRPRIHRKKFRSSVAPHLSPIKECDMTCSSPPSVRSVHTEVGGRKSTSSPSKSAKSSLDGSGNKRSSLVQDGCRENSNVSTLTTAAKVEAPSSPSKNTSFLKSSPLKIASHSSQVYPQQVPPSYSQKLYNFTPTKVFVVNDFKCNSPVRSNSSSAILSANPNPAKNVPKDVAPKTPHENSTRIMATHIRSRKFAITIVNEAECVDQTPVLQGEDVGISKESRIVDKRRPQVRSNLPDSSVDGMGNAESVGSNPEKTLKPTQNGVSHVELHM